MDIRTMVLAVSMIAVTALPCATSAQEVRQAPDLGSFVLLEGFYTRALGNLSPTFPSAAGAYAGYGHYLPDHVVLVVKAGYSGYSLADSALSGQKLSAFHLLGGPRYYFVPNGVMPFLLLNVGLNLVTEAISTPGFASNRTSVQFGWQVGLGLAYRISGPVGIEAQAKYNSHFLYHEGSTGGVEGLGNMTGFEYGVGLTWTLR
jgi:hypothetical protein